APQVGDRWRASRECRWDPATVAEGPGPAVADNPAMTTAATPQTRLLRLGHSPDSDDAFMFYGLASGKVSAPGLEFEHILRDIQTLNDWAREGRLECTAI